MTSKRDQVNNTQYFNNTTEDDNYNDTDKKIAEINTHTGNDSLQEKEHVEITGSKEDVAPAPIICSSQRGEEHAPNKVKDAVCSAVMSDPNS